MKHTVVDFQADVIAESRRAPVLVDFWAPWCGPCKMLGPVLERLAAEAAGQWSLVKLNTDEQPDLAAQFAIRSIPAVKLFHRGEAVAEFVGALPETELRSWLAQNLPTPRRETMARARELLRAGRAAEAAALLKPLASAEPTDAELAVLTARAIVFDHPAAAGRLVAALPRAHAWQDEASVVAALASALEAAHGVPARLPASAQRERYAAALDALKRQDFRGAAAALVDVLEEKPDYDDGRARAACLALFKHLGLRHPIPEEFFRRYSMAVNI